jgi:hypothetical protein
MPSIPNIRPAVAAALALATLAGSAATQAQDTKIPSPPWPIHVSDYLIVGVVWNEAAIRAALPPGIRPTADMSGGIAIYKSDGGFGISPYDSVYGFVNVEGFDTVQGGKGRWILQGLYGPGENIAAAIRATYGYAVRAGEVALSETARGRRGVARLGGREVVDVEVTLDALPCNPVAGVNHYVSGTGTKPVVHQIPFHGQWCGAQPVRADVKAPAGDPLGALVPTKLVWAGEFRDGGITFTKPITRP